MRSGAWSSSLALFSLLASCASPEMGGDASRRDATCDGCTTASDGARSDGASGGPQATDLVSLVIDPANAQLLADGTTPMPTQMFSAQAVQRDGRMRTAPQLRWSVTDERLGTIDPNTGAFTATGVGGEVTVRVGTVVSPILTASARVTIRVRRTALGTGVPEAIADRFAMATPAPMEQAPYVDYPLAGAVMPLNVYPPEVMWTPRHRTNAMDFYRVQLERPHAQITLYFAANAMGFRHNAPLLEELWRPLAGADLSEPIRLTVSVLQNNTRYDSEVRQFRTVDSLNAGAVYYWSPSTSRLSRLDVTTARRVNFLPSPGSGCIGCHTVARNGERLSGVLESPGEDLALYDLTRDLTSMPAPNLFRITTRERRCVSFNPDNTRLISGDCGANPTMSSMTVLNAMNGQPVMTMGSPGEGFDPEWSPDGTAIAYTNRMNNLAVLPVMGPDTFGMPRVLHVASSSMGGTIDWHPTWSPDSQWLVFQHGTTRRTAVNGVGALFAIRRDGTGLQRLHRLNDGETTQTSYRPQFSPFNSGGYFWLLFTSTRPYGNATAGIRNQKLIWVAAMRARSDGMSDPSEVPYFLAGQEATTSLSPYWVPPPCRNNGQGCRTGADCCSGECAPDQESNLVCIPRRGACSMRGGTCATDADCCMGLQCDRMARTCDLPPPG